MEGKIIMKIAAIVMVLAISWLGVPTTAATSGSNPSCLTSISSSCKAADNGDTNAQLDKCCTALTDAIDNQRECFCLLQSAVDNSTAADFVTVFAYCNIDGSFDTLCSTSGSTPSSTSPSDDSTSPSEDINTSTGVPSTPSSNSNQGGGNGLMHGKTNSGIKLATTSVYGLLIIFIVSIVIM